MAKDKKEAEVVEEKRYHLHAYLDYKMILPSDQYYFLKKYSTNDPFLTITEWENLLVK